MKKSISIFLVAAIAGLSMTGCSNASKNHDQEAVNSPEAEESLIQLGLDDVYNEVRKGTRLVLRYNAETKTFTGSVENVSEEILDRVQVDVHLSSGLELGPTTQIDLRPGEKRKVKLVAESGEFDSWSTHAEVGSGEHSHSHEGDEDHDHSHDDHDHSHDNHDH